MPSVPLPLRNDSGYVPLQPLQLCVLLLPDFEAQECSHEMQKQRRPSGPNKLYSPLDSPLVLPHWMYCYSILVQHVNIDVACCTFV
jgi:hypothetical protein